MMTLEEAAEHVGEPVVYRAPGSADEFGVISHATDHWVYVRYAGSMAAKCTPADMLTLVAH